MVKRIAYIVLICLFSFGSRAQEYHIGDLVFNEYGEQGIVFWLHPDGTGGWAVGLQDISTPNGWGPSIDIPDLQELAIDMVNAFEYDTAGYSNTKIIRDFLGPGITYPAQVIEFEKGWYIPAQVQLMALVASLPFIKQSIISYGGVLMEDAIYFSSSEATALSTHATYMLRAGFRLVVSKHELGSVRPIFTFKTSSFVSDTTLTYLWNTGDTDPVITQQPTETTTYTVEATNKAGCVATAEKQIFVADGTSQTIHAQICQGEVYRENGFEESEAGTYTHLLPGPGGCDVSVTLELTVGEPDTTRLPPVTICEGEHYTAYNFDLSEPGEHIQRWQRPGQCNSVVILPLSVNPLFQKVLYDTACYGEAYRENGLNLSRVTAPATHYFTRSASVGCDTSVTLHLALNPVLRTTLFDTLRFGSTYAENGFYISNVVRNGIYTNTALSSCQCDSVATLYLTVQAYTNDTTLYDTLCAGEPYNRYGFHLPAVKADTVLTDTLPNRWGVDSVICLELTVHQPAEYHHAVTVCPGKPFVGDGFTLPALRNDTLWIDTLADVRGCDSIVYREVTVDCAVCADVTGVRVNGVVWATRNVDAPGTFAATPEAYGMLYQWNRKRGWSSTSDTIITDWDNSNAPGINWETSNDPCPAGWRVPTRDDFSKLLIYDKVDDVNVMQNNVWGIKNTDRVSGRFIFLPHTSYRDRHDGELSYQFAFFYWTATAISSTGAFAWWNDNFGVHLDNVNESATSKNYGHPIRCVTDLNLTMSDTILYDTICAGEPYNKHGFSLSVIETDTVLKDTLIGYFGCDSVVYLKITVNDSIVQRETETICDRELPFTWRDTVFQTGTGSGEFCFRRNRAATSCDSIVYFTLTVNDSIVEREIETICDRELPFTWRDTVFQPGTKSGEFCFLRSQAATGCDSIIHLTLTVTSSYLFDTDTTVCPGEQVPFRGRQLNRPGVYADSLLTAAGCDSVYRFTLRCFPAWEHRDTLALCPGDTLRWNGREITTPGTYTATFPSVHGCDSTEIVEVYPALRFNGALDILLDDCETYTYLFTAVNDTNDIGPNPAYRWEFGDGNGSNDKTPLYSYADSGFYPVSLQVLPHSGCDTTLYGGVTVEYYPAALSLYSDRTTATWQEPEVRFWTDEFAGMTCEWDFGDGNQGTGVEVTHRYEISTPQSYTVHLTVTNGGACIVERNVTIRTEPRPTEEYQFPAAFTPNGDGINDTWVIQGLWQAPNNTLEIFNRKEQRVYKASPYGNDWSGTTEDGSILPAGVYVYEFTVGRKRYLGMLSIVRN